MTAMAFLMVGGGLVLLAVGGEILLRGAISIARHLGLSPMLIGLTIVACATSMPELMVTVTAGLEGSTDIGIGNIVGSNIANILLILGVGALIYPLETKPCDVMRDTIAMILATAVFMIFAFLGEFTLWHGLFMLALLALYIGRSYYREKKCNPKEEADPELAEELAAAPGSIPLAAFLLVIGVLFLIFGSELLIDGAESIARAAGISETVIGVTLVALGTSLPELATGIVAGLRKHTEVALGNALGSNIFNLLLIIGILAVVTPFTVSPSILQFDIWVMAGVSLLIIPVMSMGGKICRSKGVFFLALYAAYILYQFRDKLFLS
ncbi:calcium/sodium antiporter [Kiloniella laminariae]|uniref:Calcium/sodium antiporter n=1 Tax=Kiloniella laminariae TaxID=454162 RepID=A0ABT4LNH8_9PROT|nr:calcium/sodium antiporter [Kiloniella laminariae]MCZ4281881.1 calcium/sodium antiporter [Kiloniella laminariae]